MLKHTRKIISQWQAWKAIDSSDSAHSSIHNSSSQFGWQAAHELDDILRKAAQEESVDSTGQLRWRVLEAISTSHHSTLSPPPKLWILRPVAISVAAMLILAVSAFLWTGFFRASAPQAPSKPMVTQALFQRFEHLTNVSQSAQTLVNRVDAPYEDETRKLAQDVRHAWTFFKQRITSLPLVNQVTEASGSG